MVKGRGYPLHGHMMHKSPTHPQHEPPVCKWHPIRRKLMKGAGLKGSGRGWTVALQCSINKAYFALRVMQSSCITAEEDSCCSSMTKPNKHERCYLNSARQRQRTVTESETTNRSSDELWYIIGVEDSYRVHAAQCTVYVSASWLQCILVHSCCWGCENWFFSPPED